MWIYIFELETQETEKIPFFLETLGIIHRRVQLYRDELNEKHSSFFPVYMLQCKIAVLQ